MDPVRGRRLRLARRRKGQAGKPALVIGGLGGDEAAWRELARELARALGRGARSTADGILVQGTAEEPVARWLEERGAAAIDRG